MAMVLPSLSAGGGRKIIRVEVSLDGGIYWRQAEIIRHEKPTAAGVCVCVFGWNREDQLQLAAAQEPEQDILCR